jgi:multicomponent Na+:H+ antiporter subunit A
MPQVAAGGSLAIGTVWVPSLGLDLSFLVDGLSLTFALTVSGIGTLIIIYSGAYLAGHPHRGRFLAFMLWFMGAMLGLVLADSTPALFAFWELTSLTSFLLIGFDNRRQAARRAAIQAIVVTSSGGLGLLVAAIVMHEVGGSWDLSVLRAGGSLAASRFYPLMLVSLLMAAFTKSAQVPFHFWLPNAMEAPTPVSAFLHSATMVQAGIYLTARVSPILGGTPAWTLTLTLFGGATLIWGAVAALRQTDLKQMLAQTTIASLGLLMLLIGLGSEVAITAMAIYFLTHALYKAGLFLMAGVIDHETGTRDLTALSGLRDAMALTFIAAIMGAVSMLGLPPAIGYLAKEQMYDGLADFGPLLGALLGIVLVAGNALIGTAGLVLALKPFLGEIAPTPKPPHDGTQGLLAGPMLMGAAGLAVVFVTADFAGLVAGPMVSAVTGHPVRVHLSFAVDPFGPPFWLSLVTWAIAAACYWQLAAIRGGLRRAELGVGLSMDRGFDRVMFGLIRLAARVTHAWHHGQLELYVTVVVVMLIAALLAPFLAAGQLPPLGLATLDVSEWGVVLLGSAGVVAVLLAPSRLFSILALGVQGLATALVFLLFGAPDLAFTQFMVEILTVVVFALVMSRLRLNVRDRRARDDLWRDAALSVLAGGGITLVLLLVLSGPLDTRLGDFFTQMSVAHAHGHNIVNVILVDFRGLDTLGEISVVMGAGIAILALLQARRRGSTGPDSPGPPGEQEGP